MIAAGRQSLFNETALQDLIGEIVAEKLAAMRPQYLTITHAAEMIDGSTDFIDDVIRAGKLPVYWKGRTRLVKVSELEAILTGPAATAVAPATVETLPDLIGQIRTRRRRAP